MFNWHLKIWFFLVWFFGKMVTVLSVKSHFKFWLGRRGSCDKKNCHVTCTPVNMIKCWFTILQNTSNSKPENIFLTKTYMRGIVWMIWLLYTGITTHSPPVMSSHIIIHSSKASDFTPVVTTRTGSPSQGRYLLLFYYFSSAYM